MKILKMMLALCLCLALLAGAACADPSAELKKGEADALYPLMDFYYIPAASASSGV